jgi:plasmid stabilization system protein ParE
MTTQTQPPDSLILGRRLSGMRRYAVLRAANVGGDLARIKKHLVRSYQAFGDPKALATQRAHSRILEAFKFMLTFATHPHRGTVHPELRDSVRHVTAQQVVYYFEIDDHSTEVRILTVFVGGEDHSGQIAERLRD